LGGRGESFGVKVGYGPGFGGAMVWPFIGPSFSHVKTQATVTKVSSTSLNERTRSLKTKDQTVGKVLCGDGFTRRVSD
jgi:hypothetical protein